MIIYACKEFVTFENYKKSFQFVVSSCSFNSNSVTKYISSVYTQKLNDLELLFESHATIKELQRDFKPYVDYAQNIYFIRSLMWSTQDTQKHTFLSLRHYAWGKGLRFFFDGGSFCVAYPTPYQEDFFVQNLLNVFYYLRGYSANKMYIQPSLYHEWYDIQHMTHYGVLKIFQDMRTDCSIRVL